MTTNFGRCRLRAALLGVALALIARGVLFQADSQAIAQECLKKRAGELRIAAASDLNFAMDEIVQEFQKDHPEITVKVTYGSSGNFYSQLSNQAPFDLFFSADISYPRKLSEQGLTRPRTEFLYAIGSIVIWVPRSSPIDVEQLKMEALRHESVRHIAIANPKHAPYGKAAEAALRSLGIYEAVQPKLVFGENISQTFQFVQSGNAEIGIVALSLALAPSVKDQGRYWKVPSDAYPCLEQGGVILKWVKNVEAAQSFRNFIMGSKGRPLLRRYGFYLPGEE
ncbi:MAG TPA: molybdate ABC transporter substrate-binding protein [Terriglobia bacterium]|nr:molybdate ABC transporter substrate-binding protein [Terriglobia bacterium]